MKCQRLCPRQTLVPPLMISLNLTSNDRPATIGIAAEMVDRSDGGMGIRTDRALVPGSMLFCEVTGIKRECMVVWSAEWEQGIYYAGVKFVPYARGPG